MAGQAMITTMCEITGATLGVLGAVLTLSLIHI